MTKLALRFGIPLCFLTASTLAAQSVTIDKLDHNHSTIGFSVPIMGGLSEVEGKFTDFNVTIQLDTVDITRSSVTTTIQARSINTGIEERDNDLRSPRFFDAATFPELRFVSKRIERRASGLVAVGTLTMHGIEKPIELPFTVRTAADTPGQGVLAVSSDIVIDRDDWGVSWRHPKNMFVSNSVTLRLRILTKTIPLPSKPPA